MTGHEKRALIFNDPRTRPIHTIRGWALMRSISFVEIAFAAYAEYKKDPSLSEKRAGPYSFINLMSFNSKRFDLIPYLHLAAHQLTPMRKVK